MKTLMKNAISSRTPFLQTNRRQFLRGASVSLALPFLESYAPVAHAQCSAQAPRFIAIYIPNGVVLDHWYSHHPGEGSTPTERFANWQANRTNQQTTVFRGNEWTAQRNMSSIVEKGLKNKISLYNHISNQVLANGGYDGGEHPVGTTAFLNCAGQRRGNTESAYSIDQLIADHYASQNLTPFHSMHLSSGIEHYHADGVAQEYSENISWRADGSPVSAYVSPRLAFERYFGGASFSDPELRKKSSILDYIRSEALNLENRLGAEDRQRLDAYLTSVRSLEQAIAASGETGQCAVPNRNDPHYVLGDINYSTYDRTTHMRLHYDIMALAARCNLTNVMTYVVDHERSEYNYGPGAGDHHGAQHGSSNNLSNIIDILMAEFATFLESLDDIVDPNGSTALDNSVVMMGSGLMGRFYDHRAGDEDNTHQRKALPLVFAGSGGGILQTNQHVSLPYGTKLANVFTTLLQNVYCTPQQQFANSDGLISEMVG